MDGCWWSCSSDTDSHLFVDESHRQIGDEGINPKWRFEFEGSSLADRSSFGLSIHKTH
jgi:hypothetical protein